MDSTIPTMPMGKAAQLPLNTADVLANMPRLQNPSTPPPPQAAGLIGAQGGFPAPGAPDEPPFTVQLQPDGSSVYLTKTDPPIILSVNKPPPLPKALQPQK